MFRNIFLSLLLIVGLVACNDDNHAPNADHAEKAHRTVLLYCAAQNSLGFSSKFFPSFWSEDSVEIMAGKHFIDADDRFLVFVDDAYHPRLYRFRADAAPEIVFQWGYDANSSDPATLKDVLLRVKERFPADEYGLTMWSHADGWIPSSNTNYSAVAPMSFGIDVGKDGNMSNDKIAGGKNIGAQMNIDDMARVIAESGMHFQYIFFDACLMQCIEVGYELRNVTDYIIASPISIASAGAYYTHMLERGLFAKDPCDIAKTYYEDVTSPELQKYYDDFGIVVSVLKTSELSRLATEVCEALKNVDFTAYPDVKDAHAYQTYTNQYFYRPHYYDMRSVLQRLLTDEAFERVDAALSRAIPFYAGTQKYWVGPSMSAYHNITPDCCGVSMFIPQKVYSTNASACLFGNHNQTYTETAWAKAIGKGAK